MMELYLHSHICLHGMAAHFYEAGIKLLKTERKGNNSVRTIYLVEPFEIFFLQAACLGRKVVHF
jgi:hypothetical protein